MVRKRKSSILKLGTKTQWGTIEAVGYIGERYYWMRDKQGVITMMPHSLVKDMSTISKFRKREEL